MATLFNRRTLALPRNEKTDQLGSKFRKNSGRNSGSGPFSVIFGPKVAGIIFWVSLFSGLFN
jgi:hypothetical protein